VAAISIAGYSLKQFDIIQNNELKSPMSYDIRIRKDEEYSGQTGVESLRVFIASLPEVTANGRQGFVYIDEKELWMGIDLEWREQDGDIINAKDKLNLISCHIPYAFWDESKADKYFAICVIIADHLNWQAFDAQTDQLIN
jgi:hypothetical protein